MTELENKKAAAQAILEILKEYKHIELFIADRTIELNGVVFDFDESKKITGIAVNLLQTDR